jgi:hypothetical protein
MSPVIPDFQDFRRGKEWLSEIGKVLVNRPETRVADRSCTPVALLVMAAILLATANRARWSSVACLRPWSLTRRWP